MRRGRMMTPLSTSFVVRSCDSAPTSHMEDHPQATHTHTHTHTHTLRVTENPVPVRGSTVFICFHTNKPRSGSSPPHAGHSEQLSRWITGRGGVEQFPVQPTTEEKITHIGYSASPFPSAPLLQGIPSEAFIRLTQGVWVVVSVWDGASACVGAGFRCRESSLRTEWRLFSDAAGAAVDRE